MRRSPIRKIYLSVLLFLFVPGALWAKVVVAVSILPQKSFVEKIAGDLADVTVMVPPGASPASYEPKASQMKKITRAEIYFAIGVPFEKAWLPRFAAQNPKMKIVDVTAGIKKRPMVSHRHEHGSGHHHREDSLDPHVWLSPPLVAIVAENIAEALKDADPEHAAEYMKNLERFKREIEALDRELRKILEPCRGTAMMVFHPSWGYFANQYGLRQIPIEAEGKEPRSKRLAELIKEAKEEGVKAIFVQPQFSKRAAEAIADSIGAEVVVADPMAADWAESLIDTAKELCKAAR